MVVDEAWCTTASLWVLHLASKKGKDVILVESEKRLFLDPIRVDLCWITHGFHNRYVCLTWWDKKTNRCVFSLGLVGFLFYIASISHLRATILCLLGCMCLWLFGHLKQVALHQIHPTTLRTEEGERNQNKLLTSLIVLSSKKLAKTVLGVG